MSKDITISGKVVYKDGTPIAGAQIKIWETDALQKNNRDDLIVNDTTGANGRFSGSGRWKDSGLIDKGTYRYEITYKGQVKTGGNILNPHQFFKEVNTRWLSPAQKQAETEKESITLSGRVVYQDGTPIEGAQIKIWETDALQQNNRDDLIVNDTTDANGRFFGSGRWKDSGLIDKGTYRYEITYKDQVKTGGNILNPHGFFAEVRTDWSSTVVWSNWLESHETEIPQQGYTHPGSRSDLEAVFERAVRENLKIKVVGSGHSHSKVAQPSAGNILIDLGQLSGSLPAYPWLKPRSQWQLQHPQHQLVRVKSGTTIRSLYREILAPERLGLINMGSFDGQTVAGAINTNTHGTGITLPGFADMVRSVEMYVIKPVSPRHHVVECWVIEPTDGISDPKQFKQAAPGKFLVQNDDVFYSAVCGYGLFGVAYSYTLEVRDLYWLQEDSRSTDWQGLKRQLSSQTGGVPDFLNNFHQVKLYVHTAQCLGKGGLEDDTPCRIDTWTEKPLVLKPDGWDDAEEIHPIWPPMRPRGFQSLGTLLSGATFDVNGVFNNGKPSPATISTLTHGFFNAVKGHSFLRGYSASAYYRAIRRSRDNTLKADPALKHNKIDNTEAKGPSEASDFATSVEICVPVGATREAIKKSMDYLTRTGVNFLTPTGVRFTRRSNHYLSPAFDQDCAFIEIAGWLPDNRRNQWPKFKQLYNQAFGDLIRYLRQEIPGVRFHLGKFNIDAVSTFRADYPKFDRWLAHYHLFNASGLFDCPNSKKWQLDQVDSGLSMAEAARRLERLKS